MATTDPTNNVGIAGTFPSKQKEIILALKYGEIQNPSFNVLIIDLTLLKSEEIFGAPNKI